MEFELMWYLLEIVSDSYLDLVLFLGFLCVEGNKFSLVWKKWLFLAIENFFMIKEVIEYSLSIKE